jgi:hypothetical protein
LALVEFGLDLVRSFTLWKYQKARIPGKALPDVVVLGVLLDREGSWSGGMLIDPNLDRYAGLTKMPETSVKMALRTSQFARGSCFQSMNAWT